MGKATRQGDQQPRRWLRVADQHTHAASHHRTRLDDLLRLLDTADEHEEMPAPILRLGATTGLRRGELSGPRRDRLHSTGTNCSSTQRSTMPAESSSRSKRKRGAAGQSAPTRPPRSPPTAPCRDGCSGSALWDQHCADWLRVQPRPHLQHSLAPGAAHATDAPTAQGARSHRWQLRRHDPRAAQVDNSELMNAGFNPAAVSGRQGHTVQVMLHHYSTRRQSAAAEKAAADHLGQRIHGDKAD